MAEIHEEISVELPSVEEQSRSRERMAREELDRILMLEAERINAISSQMYEQSIHEDKRVVHDLPLDNSPLEGNACSFWEDSEETAWGGTSTGRKLGSLTGGAYSLWSHGIQAFSQQISNWKDMKQRWRGGTTEVPNVVPSGCAPTFWEDSEPTEPVGTSADHSTSGQASANQQEREETAVAIGYVWEDYHKKISALPKTANECRPITIFSLPSYIRETNSAMHRPKLVSIGPYYLDNNGPLRTLQEHKWWCARDFMDAHKMDRQECIHKIETKEPMPRSCYSEEVALEREGFVQMLLLDGCFILEFIRKHHGDVLDSFFSIERNKATIMTDILLLENQIPYFIIHELFNLATGNSSCSETSCQLRDLIFGFLPTQIFWREPQIPCDKIHHLLHFYYLCMVPDPWSKHGPIQSASHKNTEASDKITMGRLELEKVRKPRRYNVDVGKPLVMPSVTELTEACVKFRRKTQPSHLFDVTFKNGVMEIPALFIHDLNCILLANLLGFEQSSYGPKGIISHFVSLFDNLIDTEKDVSLLESSDVLINMIGSEKETASFFNQLGKWNLVEHSTEYFNLITDVQAYYNSLWPKYRAILMRDYLTNPWTIISVIAAFVLLGLTIVQTYYTIYSSIHN